MGIHIKSVDGSVVIEQRGADCKVWILRDGFFVNEGLLRIDYSEIPATVEGMTADEAIAHFDSLLQSIEI